MLKVGLIGVGHLGTIHLSQLLQIDGIQVVGVFDADDHQARKGVAETGVPVYDRADLLMEAAEAIDIVSPTASHFQYAVDGIAKGKHVFIEKPLAGSVEQAEKIARSVESGRPVVQVGHVERFNPAYRAAIPYFSDPLFIEAHRLAQFNPRGTDVSVIFDLMIHDLDIVLSLNDSEVTGIHASGVAVVSDTPDIANARIEFANGCVANLTASRMSVKKMRKARFFQKDAYISVDFLKRKTEVIRMKPLEGDPDPLAIVVDTGRGDDRKVIHFDNPEVPETNAIRDELSGFAEAIRNGTPPGVTAHDGYRAVKVAHAISEKIKTASPLLA